MKKTTLLLLLLFNISLFAQYTSCYYFLIGEASFLASQEKYEESAVFYNKAFNLQSDGFVFHFIGAAKTFDQLSENKKVYTFLEKAIQKGYTWEEIEKAEWKYFRKSRYWNKLKSKYLSLHNAFVLGIDKETRDELLKMDYTDQFVRKNLNWDTKTFYAILGKTDSVNLALFKEMVEKKGFPDLQKLGYKENYDKPFTLILHFCKDDTTQYSYFNPIMQQAMKEGKFRPEDYAGVIDMYTLTMDKKIFFCEIFKDYKDKKIAQISEIDRRRFAIGLIPLYQLAQKKKITELPEGYVPVSDEELQKWCGCDKESLTKQ